MSIKSLKFIRVFEWINNLWTKFIKPPSLREVARSAGGSSPRTCSIKCTFSWKILQTTCHPERKRRILKDSSLRSEWQTKCVYRSISASLIYPDRKLHSLSQHGWQLPQRGSHINNLFTHSKKLSIANYTIEVFFKSW